MKKKILENAKRDWIKRKKRGEDEKGVRWKGGRGKGNR